MRKETKHFVTFWAPGALFAESWNESVVPPLNPLAIKWPENAYCFTLHEQEILWDGETKFTGPIKQICLRYYHPDSKVETLEEVQKNPNATATLIRNMKYNNWRYIIWSRWSNWPQQFDETQEISHNFYHGHVRGQRTSHEVRLTSADFYAIMGVHGPIPGPCHHNCGASTANKEPQKCMQKCPSM